MKTIFISGISSGIGKGLAQYYAGQGVTVLGISRRALDYTHPKIQHRQVDITCAPELTSVLEQLFETIDFLDCAVLNAAILGEIKMLVDCTIRDLKSVMDTNLWGQKESCDLVLKHFPGIKQVIAISSGASVNGNRGWNAYSISKAALNMLIKIYAAENEQTHFCAFAPGLVDTHMQDQLWEVSEEEFPAVTTLHQARYTEVMPAPEHFAQKFEKARAALFNYPSGSYVDIRMM